MSSAPRPGKEISFYFTSLVHKIFVLARLSKLGKKQSLGFSFGKEQMGILAPGRDSMLYLGRLHLSTVQQLDNWGKQEFSNQIEIKKHLFNTEQPKHIYPGYLSANDVTAKVPNENGVCSCFLERKRDVSSLPSTARQCYANWLAE